MWQVIMFQKIKPVSDMGITRLDKSLQIKDKLESISRYCDYMLSFSDNNSDMYLFPLNKMTNVLNNLNTIEHHMDTIADLYLYATINPPNNITANRRKQLEYIDSIIHPDYKDVIID